MFSDSYQFYDAEGDDLRARDEKATEFFNPGDEGAGIDDFLQPGDLVAIAGYAPRLSIYLPIPAIAR